MPVWMTGKSVAWTRLFQPPYDTRFVEIVRGHLHFDPIADSEAHPALAHFTGDGGKNEVFVVQFDPEHGPRQNGMDDTFDFNGRFFHKAIRAAGG